MFSRRKGRVLLTPDFAQLGVVNRDAFYYRESAASLANIRSYFDSQLSSNNSKLSDAVFHTLTSASAAGLETEKTKQLSSNIVQFIFPTEIEKTKDEHSSGIQFLETVHPLEEYFVMGSPHAVHCARIFLKSAVKRRFKIVGFMVTMVGAGGGGSGAFYSQDHLVIHGGNGGGGGATMKDINIQFSDYGLSMQEDVTLEIHAGHGGLGGDTNSPGEDGGVSSILLNDEYYFELAGGKGGVAKPNEVGAGGKLHVGQNGRGGLSESHLVPCHGADGGVGESTLGSTGTPAGGNGGGTLMNLHPRQYSSSSSVSWCGRGGPGGRFHGSVGKGNDGEGGCVFIRWVTNTGKCSNLPSSLPH